MFSSDSSYTLAWEALWRPVDARSCKEPVLVHAAKSQTLPLPLGSLRLTWWRINHGCLHWLFPPNGAMCQVFCVLQNCVWVWENYPPLLILSALQLWLCLISMERVWADAGLLHRSEPKRLVLMYGRILAFKTLALLISRGMLKRIFSCTRWWGSIQSHAPVPF